MSVNIKLILYIKSKDKDFRMNKSNHGSFKTASFMNRSQLVIRMVLNQLNHCSSEVSAEFIRAMNDVI